ncbi:hypothetical protein AVEN_73498-1 [Araneus ventricosus]|uniref:Uncharacterized protein n=1 Tax=Araneus ventricosus TaxID=182803 RepID=A0A4Y2FCW8_ARAVE|nr:hypothetical protein AVEN_73498-1 [Araneus ventricosus]
MITPTLPFFQGGVEIQNIELRQSSDLLNTMGLPVFVDTTSSNLACPMLRMKPCWWMKNFLWTLLQLCMYQATLVRKSDTLFWFGNAIHEDRKTMK